MMSSDCRPIRLAVLMSGSARRTHSSGHPALSVSGWGVDHAVMEVRPARFVMARTEFLRPQRRVVAQRVGMDDQGEVTERKSLAVAVLRDRSSECRGERSGVARAP